MFGKRTDVGFVQVWGKLKKNDKVSKASRWVNLSKPSIRTKLFRQGNLVIFKGESNTKERSPAITFSQEKHTETPYFEINLKGMITCESMLRRDDSVHNKDDLLYGSSDDEFFGNSEILQHTFSACRRNIHNRHKVCKCDRYGKGFPSSSKLQRRYLTHAGQKPFGCMLCVNMFRQSAHLKSHQLSHTEKSLSARWDPKI